MAHKKANEKTGPNLKRGPGNDFVITTGRILVAPRAFFGDITGQPPPLNAYQDPDPPGTSKTSLNRPGGAKQGPSIDSVTIKKGKK